MIEITPPREDDRQAWQPLAVGYNAFYERTLPDADYDGAWRRLLGADILHGLAPAASMTGSRASSATTIR